MRGPCSEQQKKDLSVYDFDAEDFTAEGASDKYRKRTTSRLNSESESLTPDSKLKQTDGITCVNMHENGSPQGSSGIDSPERNLTTDEKSELLKNKTSPASFRECGKVYQNEFDPEVLSRVGSLIAGASGLVAPSLGHEQASNLQSDGTSVDVISDDEETYSSASVSPTSSASDHIEDEDHLKNPPSEDGLNALGEKDEDELVATISPDFVIYKNTLYGEAKVLFFTQSVLVKCLDTSGNNENINLEWAIADILHIECHFSDSASASLVKFHLRTTTGNGNEHIGNTCDTVKLIVSVSDACWLNEELKDHLIEKYNDIRKDPEYDRSALEDDNEVDMFFPRDYFTEIPDSFEEVVYPKGDPDAVSISRRDFELLQPDTFINDTIIDFYIKHLKSKIPSDERHRFHFFNSFFFRKLADLDKDPESASKGRAAFLRVRKWTRKVNIFEKDYIFIPVNFNLHWSLLVICHPGDVSVLKEDKINDSPKVPCILHMDSIKGSHSGLQNLVQSYLLEEWKERHPESTEDFTSKFTKLRFVSLELPQQTNSFDCGLFLLHYVELFLEETPVNFNPFKISAYSCFLTEDWFIPSEASLKRSLIRKLICDLLHDSSQKVTPTPCNNVHLSAGYHDDTMYHKRTVELFNLNSGPSNSVHDKSTCSVTVKGIEMNLEIRSSPVVQSDEQKKLDKQEGLVMHDFLGPATNSMSIFQEAAPFQSPTFATDPKKVQVDQDEQLLTLNIDRVDNCAVCESSSAQTSTPSRILKNAGESETPLTSMVDKVETGLDLLSRKCKDEVSNGAGLLAKGSSVLMEDCGFVPDSPSSDGENPKIDTRTDEDWRRRVFREIDSSRMDDGGSRKDSQKIDASEEDEGGSCEGPQKIDASSEDEDDSCEETKSHYVKSEEVSAADHKDVDNDDFEETEEVKTEGTAGDDDSEKHSNETNIFKAHDLGGENCRIVDATSEVDGVKQKDCSACNTHIVLDCEEAAYQGAPQNSKDLVINPDKKLMVKDVAGREREEPSRCIEIRYQKRRKISQVEEGRRRTRRISRGGPS